MNVFNNISNIDQTQFSEDKPVRILSIDGGGVRGICPQRLLLRLKKEPIEFLQNYSILSVEYLSAALSAWLYHQKNSLEIEL